MAESANPTQRMYDLRDKLMRERFIDAAKAMQIINRDHPEVAEAACRYETERRRVDRRRAA